MSAPHLHFVTGKGGVGKTSVACAFALAYANAGKKVLLAEFNGGDRVADALDVEPVGYAMREVLPKLWAIDLTPEASLREYVLLIIKVQAIYRAIFEGRLVASFLRLLPALGELTMLGKVWYECQQKDGSGAPRFDVIVLDAPATGHARALLMAARAVQDSVPKGPMRDNAERIDAMLHAPNARLEIVTTAEDMPITEAQELLAFADKQSFAHCRVLANQVAAPLGDASAALVAQLQQAPGDLQAVGRTLSQREVRARRGQAMLGRLGAGLAVRLPCYPHAAKRRAMLEEMAQQLRQASMLQGLPSTGGAA